MYLKAFKPNKFNQKQCVFLSCVIPNAYLSMD